MRWPEQLASEQVLLRPPMADDARPLFDGLTSQAEAARYVTWKPHESVEETLTLIERFRDEWAGDATERTWAIDLRDDSSTPMGMITARSGNHGVELGYAIATACWGHGIATHAVAVVTDWALTAKESHRVWATCDVANVASRRVLSKAGFAEEGVLRRWAVHPNVSPEPRDCSMHSTIR